MKMNFKILKSSATFHGVEYSEKKQKQGCAKLLHFENFGPLQDGRENVSKEEFENYLMAYSKRNNRVTKPQFHAVMTCKGREFSEEELKTTALQVMDKLGYNGIPILIYSHSDTDNNHVHIVTSRVGEDGRKIPHDLEGIRANNILKNILGQDSKQDLKTALKNTLEYKFSTKMQFLLLLENRGYKIKETEKTIEFSKHGTVQGEIDKDEIQKKIEENKRLQKNAAQIKAIIKKYSERFSPDLKRDERIPYTTEKLRYNSELTNYLSRNFGYEFAFFIGAGQVTPYGYALIDHKNKTVYKGNEILKLNDLIGLYKEKYIKRRLGDHTKKSKNPEIKGGIKEAHLNSKDVDHIQTAIGENFNTEFGKLPDLIGILAADNTPVDVSAGESKKRKKKKKNQFF